MLSHLTFVYSWYKFIMNHFKTDKKFAYIVAMVTRNLHGNRVRLSKFQSMDNLLLSILLRSGFIRLIK